MSSERVTAADRVRDEIDGLFTDPERELGTILEEVARLSVRLVFQTALEAEVMKSFGRDRYARGERARAGLRNGYSDTTIKTTPGRSRSSAPRCAAGSRRSRHGCWTSTSPAPTRSSRW